MPGETHDKFETALKILNWTCVKLKTHFNCTDKTFGSNISCIIIVWLYHGLTQTTNKSTHILLNTSSYTNLVLIPPAPFHNVIGESDIYLSLQPNHHH